MPPFGARRGAHLPAPWKPPCATKRHRSAAGLVEPGRDGPPSPQNHHLHHHHHFCHPRQGSPPQAPPTPQLGLMFLECLLLEVLLLFFFLLRVFCRFLFLHGGAPFLALSVILLHRRLRGPGVDRPLTR